MQDFGDEEESNALLRYFGIETGDEARRTLLWAAPYLLLLAAGLLVLSFVVHFYLSLPFWFYAIAIGLAALNLFFLLARARQMEIEARTGAGDGDSPPEQ